MAIYGSIYWKITLDHDSRHNSYIGWRQLDLPVISLLEKALANHPNIADDTELNMSFGNSSTTTGCENLRATSITHVLDRSITESAWDLRLTLRHQNVPTISITALVTVNLTVSTLAAIFDDRWVIYRPLLAGRFGAELLWREVQTLAALRGASYVAQLVAVVVDSTTGPLRGVLVELPAKGLMCRLMEAHKRRGRPIPWPIRQKWAKQIVRGVAAYHKRGQVVREIRITSWCTCIDEHNDANIVGLSYSNHPSVYSNGKSVICDKHNDPIALPKAASDVPDYLDRIIALCRRADAQERPAAWELLQMFPTDQEIQGQIDNLHSDRVVITIDPYAVASSAKISRLEMVQKLYGPVFICDFCTERIYCRFYLCEVCHMCNFTICERCFDQGIHCLNEAQLLVQSDLECFRNQGYANPGAYDSSVNADGQREEITS